MGRTCRILLLLLVACAILGALWVGPRIGWDALAVHEEALLQWVVAHPVAAPLIYLLAYILTAALSLPHAALLTVAGGLLFGRVFGCALTVAGATTGGSILLLVTRSAFGDVLARRGGGALQRVQAGLDRDGFSYLLALRLLPVVPFWVVNLAAAVVGMRLSIFVPATALGIIPISFTISSIGAGVGEVLASGGTPDFSVLFAPRLVLPLIALAMLSLLPMVWRRARAANA
jgi:uncharacterized membrane protein YdjX (TVP38/TMEM64 family)